MLRLLGAALLASCAATGSASAHPGTHHGMSLTELAAHLGTGWHLMSLVAAALVGALVLAIALRQRRHADAARTNRTSRDRS